MKSRIVLADDHRIIRQGLRELLEKQPDLEVAAEAEDGRRAVELVQKLRPDIVVMDIGMPELNGIEATRQILAEVPHVRIIALSMHSDRHFVARMLQAGAMGYLLKDCAFEELVNAIRTVNLNRTYLSQGIADVVISDYVRRLEKTAEEEDKPAHALLTAREREVLQLLAEGRSTKEIAGELNVSVKTVETHRQHIMEKVEANSIAELTKYAIRQGLTSLEG